MTKISRIIFLGILFSLPAAADEPSFQDELLDKFVGTWVLRGTIAGGEVTHDIVAGWTLGHHPIRSRLCGGGCSLLRIGLQHIDSCMLICTEI